MLTLNEYWIQHPEELTPETMEKIGTDPEFFKSFLIQNLLEPEDELRILDTRIPGGLKREFIASRPDGRWRKQTLVVPDPGAANENLLKGWAMKQQTLTAYKWQLSGRKLEDWDLATLDNIDGIRKDIEGLTQEEIQEAEQDWRRSQLLWGQKKN